MKNEWLVNAVGHIDGDLLQDALTARPKRVTFAGWRRWGALAACLALLVVSVSLYAAGSVRASLYGTPIGRTPLSVSDPSLPAPVRIADPDQITELELTLELTLRRPTAVTVSAGVIGPADGALPYADGSCCTAQGKVTIIWYIEAADPSVTYTLKAGSRMLLLSFELPAGWVIRQA